MHEAPPVGGSREVDICNLTPANIEVSSLNPWPRGCNLETLKLHQEKPYGKILYLVWYSTSTLILTYFNFLFQLLECVTFKRCKINLQIRCNLAMWYLCLWSKILCTLSNWNWRKEVLQHGNTLMTWKSFSSLCSVRMLHIMLCALISQKLDTNLHHLILSFIFYIFCYVSNRKMVHVKPVEKVGIFCAVKLVLMPTILSVYFHLWKRLSLRSGSVLNVYVVMTTLASDSIIIGYEILLMWRHLCEKNWRKSVCLSVYLSFLCRLAH